VLEKIDTCRTAIFDKTGTLTYGQPKLTGVVPAGFTEEEVLALVAGLERRPIRLPLCGLARSACGSAQGVRSHLQGGMT
jgi:hypothetical protein